MSAVAEMIGRVRASLLVKVACCALPLIVFAVLSAISFGSRKATAACYAETSFFIILALFILWIVCLCRYLACLNFSPVRFFREYAFGIGLAAFVTIGIFLSVPVYLKILNDEANLLAVSQSMVYFRDARYIAMATFFGGDLQVVQFEIPIRPLLFPFLASLFHFAFGYHYQNVFVLNFLLTFFFLAGCYVCTRQFTDRFSSGAAIFLVASYPIFSICGTSGGYDLLSTCFFYLAAVLLYRHLKSPGPIGFAFLWATLLMLANVRNESILFFALMAAGVVLVTRKLYSKQIYCVYAWTPLVLLPYIWQRILSVGRYENPEGVALFSISALIDHLWILIVNFLNLDFFLPYAGILNALALGLSIYLIAQILLGKLHLVSWQSAFWSIFALCLFSHTVITLAHFMGIYDHPAQARFFLNLSVAGALTPVLFQAVQPTKITGKILLSGSIMIFALYHPIAVKHLFVDTLLTSRTHRAEIEYLKQLKDSDVMVLSAYPSQFSTMGYNSISIRYANSHSKNLKVEMEDRLISKIVAFQHVYDQTDKVVFETQVLNPVFKIRPIKSVDVLPEVSLRISDVGFD